MTEYKRLLVPVLVVAVLAAVPVAIAAGPTTVSIDPPSTTVEPGATTTVDIVVDDATGGVGAYNLTVSIPDPAVVTVDGIDIAGDPTMQDTNITDDRVRVEVIGLDTSDKGSVDVLSIVLRAGDSPGTSTDLSVSVAALGDETGNSYTIQDTAGATISVQEPTTTSTTTTETDGQPGFGLTVVFIAATVIGALMYRYRD